MHGQKNIKFVTKIVLCAVKLYLATQNSREGINVLNLKIYLFMVY